MTARGGAHMYSIVGPSALPTQSSIRFMKLNMSLVQHPFSVETLAHVSCRQVDKPLYMIDTYDGSARGYQVGKNMGKVTTT